MSQNNGKNAISLREETGWTLRVRGVEGAGMLWSSKLIMRRFKENSNENNDLTTSQSGEGRGGPGRISGGSGG